MLTFVYQQQLFVLRHQRSQLFIPANQEHVQFCFCNQLILVVK